MKKFQLSIETTKPSLNYHRQFDLVTYLNNFFTSTLIVCTMEPQRHEIMIMNFAEDISEIIKGYSKIYIERCYGNLWFFKDGLQAEDAIQIEVGKTYDLHGIVQIQRMNRGKSKPTISFVLS